MIAAVKCLPAVLMLALVFTLSSCQASSGSILPQTAESNESPEVNLRVIDTVYGRLGGEEAALEIVLMDEADNPYLRYMNGGEERLQPVTEIAWLRYVSCEPADVDGDGEDELIFLLWTGGSGGQGSHALCVLHWEETAFAPFAPVPLNPEGLESERIGFGYHAEIEMLDDGQAKLFCRDTGREFDFTVNREYGNPDVYTEDGALAAKPADIPTGIDYIGSAWISSADNRQSVVIAQMIWAGTRAGIACFVNEFMFENGEAVIIDQYVDSDVERYSGG